MITFRNKPAFFFSLFRGLFPGFLLLLTIFTAGNAFAQAPGESEKLVKNLNLVKGPVEVVGIKNSRQTIKFGEKFTQGSDWFSDLTIKLKNTSDKPVIYVGIGLDFPETKTTGYEMSFSLNYGILSLEPAIKNDKTEPVAPGAVFEVKLDEKKYESLKKFIETRQLLDGLSEVGIRIGLILFDDDTGWSGGPMRRDPNNPRRFVPTGQDK